MFSGFMDLSPIDIRKTSDVHNGIPLGTWGFTRSGKAYRWSKNGGTALATGKLNVNADMDSNVVNKTVAATVAAGAFQVVVDAAGAITADAYRDGFLTVNDATGEGHDYLIVSNTGTSGAAEMTVTLANPLVEGLTVDVSEVILSKHAADGVVISATDQADMPTGISNTAVAASYYFWNQVWGNCSALADETLNRGKQLTTGTGTAGAVEELDAVAEPVVGFANQGGVDTEYPSISLQIIY